MTLLSIRNMIPHCSQPMLGVVMLSALTLLAPVAAAQSLSDDKPPKEKDRQRDNPQDDPTRAELRKRFEARFERLNDLKDQGSIGESFDGHIAALDPRLLSKDERQLLDDENADRKSLYALIAERVDEGEKKVPPRIVAERNGKRNFEKADARHFLKTEESRWIQKRDEARAQRIARLKKDGVVGETFEGSLDVIKGKGDEEVQRVIDQENRDRRAMYDQVAGRIDKANAEQIAREAAKDMYEHLPAGHAYKSKDGAWERRPARER